MAFDECTPGDADYGYAKQSLELTERWLDRCITRMGRLNAPMGMVRRSSPLCRDVFTPI